MYLSWKPEFLSVVSGLRPYRPPNDYFSTRRSSRRLLVAGSGSSASRRYTPIYFSSKRNHLLVASRGCVWTFVSRHEPLNPTRLLASCCRCSLKTCTVLAVTVTVSLVTGVVVVVADGRVDDGDTRSFVTEGRPKRENHVVFNAVIACRSIVSYISSRRRVNVAGRKRGSALWKVYGASCPFVGESRSLEPYFKRTRMKERQRRSRGRRRWSGVHRLGRVGALVLLRTVAQDKRPEKKMRKVSRCRIRWCFFGKTSRRYNCGEELARVSTRNGDTLGSGSQFRDL